jgi:hypothetical protein
VSQDFKTYEFTVSQHYLSALINGDESGLDKSDRALIADFLGQFEGSTSVCLAEVEDYQTGEKVEQIDPEFRRCQISGLKSDCFVVSVLEFTKTGGVA